MLKNILVGAILLATTSVWAAATAEQSDRNESVYNLENGDLGLKGYDPVSYFPEGGETPLKGSNQISTVYGGVMYVFANEANRDTFLQDPTRFEPTYGGWCAWAMANQAYADINPELFTNNEGRMHFFISKGAKARFDNDLANREQAADDYWKSESGEEPRL